MQCYYILPYELSCGKYKKMVSGEAVNGEWSMVNKKITIGNKHIAKRQLLPVIRNQIYLKNHHGQA